VSEEEMSQSMLTRGLIDGIEEVAGVKGRNMVLRHANLEEYIDNPPPMTEELIVPRAHYRAIEKALMDVFGRGSQALLFYIGEAATRRGIEGVPAVLASAMRLLPGGLKKKAIFKVAVDQTAKLVDIPPRVEFAKDKIIFYHPGCVSCEGYETDQPICAYAAGLLMPLAELAAGKRHKVTEVECKAMGDKECVFEITEM